MNTSMKEDIITFTPAAVKHIQQIIAQRGSGKGLRVAVKASGCSGYMYQPDIVEEGKPNDLQWTTAEGLLVFIDPTCVPWLQGTVLDVVSKELGQRQLRFHNPNVHSECGCGESFNVKDNDHE